MSKPLNFPQWSTDQNFTGGPENGTPTKVEPSSGKKGEGWEPSEEPAPQSLNWWMNNVGEWQKYFGHRVGRVTDLSTNWWWLFQRVSPGAGVIIPGSAAKCDGDPLDTGAPTYVNSAWTMGTSTKVLYYPVQVLVGSVLTGWKLYLRKTSATGTLTAQLFRRNMTTGTETAIGSTDTDSTNNPGFITLDHTLTTPYKVQNSQEEYYLKFTPSGVTGDFAAGAQVLNYVDLTPWTTLTAGGGTVTTTVLSTVIGGGIAAVLDVPANTDLASVIVRTELRMAPCDSKTVHLMEWECDTTELVGTPGLTFAAGFSNGGAVTDAVSVEKTSASANYFLRTTNGTGPTTTNTNTNVAAASGVTRFTLLWFGSAVDSGGQRAELYINGALVATNTTNMPSGVIDFSPTIGLLSTGATTSTMHVSPLRYLSVRYLFGD